MAVNITWGSSGGSRRGVPLMYPVSTESVAVAVGASESAVCPGGADMVRIYFAEDTNFLVNEGNPTIDAAAGGGSFAPAGKTEFWPAKAGLTKVYTITPT